MVLLNPFRSNVPPLTVSTVVGTPVAAPSRNVPALTIVAPVHVLLPLSTSRPAPTLVSDCAPSMLPLMVSVLPASAPIETAAAATPGAVQPSVTLPVIVLLPEKFRNAPLPPPVPFR